MPADGDIAMDTGPIQKRCSAVVEQYIAEKQTNAIQHTWTGMQWIGLTRTWAAMNPKPTWFHTKRAMVLRVG